MSRTRQIYPLIRNLIKRSAHGVCDSGGNRKGLVLGCYNGCSPGEFKLTRAAEEFDKSVVGKLSEHLKGTGVPLGESLLLTNLNEEYYGVAVGGLGEEGAGYDDLEKLNVCKENIRVAAGLAARKLQEIGVGAIHVEEFTNMEAAAEGVGLSVWQYQDLKSQKKPNPKIENYKSVDPDGFQRGMCKAEAQNLARYLEEVPANLMTPTGFAEHTIEQLCPCGVQVDVRDRDWIETMKMSAFLAVADSSCEPLLFLEVKYCGGELGGQPILLAGKGITYDTGGLCLKKKEVMSEYRGDLAGAAVIVGSIRCAARMALPINIIGLIPLCENCIGGLSTKPGDVIMSRTGKTIRIADPDNEGRIILTDALSYSNVHKPCFVGTIATMTPGIRWTLGSGGSGIFTIKDDTWAQFERAGSETGDRFWRMPSFWDLYRRKITDYCGVDISNVGLQPGNTCQAAAFLKEFSPEEIEFVHMDITGVGMLSTGVGHPYLRQGIMTGRPTRTLVQFYYQVACPHDSGKDC